MGLEDFYSGGSAPAESAIGGLDEEFQNRLYAMLLALPDELKGQVTILSGHRTIEHQQRLWDAAVAKYGSEEAARKWVAPPGRSNHNHGHAADLTYNTAAGKKWVHENAARYGLAFHLDHEPWHIEPAGLRSGEYSSQSSPIGQAPDPEAYTDGQGIPTVNNHSLETQLLRVADIVNGSTSGTRNQMRVADPRKLAELNAQLTDDNGGVL